MYFWIAVFWFLTVQLHQFSPTFRRTHVYLYNYPVSKPRKQQFDIPRGENWNTYSTQRLCVVLCLFPWVSATIYCHCMAQCSDLSVIRIPTWPEQFWATIDHYFPLKLLWQFIIIIIIIYCWPRLWSSGQSFWLQIQRSRVRFPALPDFSE